MGSAVADENYRIGRTCILPITNGVAGHLVMRNRTQSIGRGTRGYSGVVSIFDSLSLHPAGAVALGQRIVRLNRKVYYVMITTRR